MCKFVHSFLIGLIVLTVRVQAASPASQVIISEFMAQNTTSISDDFGDKSDWIEIYNGGANAIDLGGWHLTDTTNDLKKWTFPTTTLAANSFLLVFASNRDRRNPNSPLHTNFRLEALGEYLGLIQPDGTNVATEFRPVFPRQVTDVSYGFATDAHDLVLLTTGNVARASVPTNDIGLTWTEADFPDQAWLSGTAGVGYDTTPSPVDYNPLLGLNLQSAMLNVNPSVYIRVPFVVTNVAEIDTLTFGMQYDDGFIAYINGANVLASDNSANPPLYNSTTANRADATAITVTSFNATSSRDFLHVGTNILSIHGQNQAVGSSDLLMLPQLIARTKPSGNLVLRYFPIPTPGAANNAGVAVVGPIVTEVQHSPLIPQDNQDVVVSARVSLAFSPVNTLRLHYRVMYSNEVDVQMYDDGTHGDVTPFNGVFSTSIPASASNPGQMIRWYIRATDFSNVVTRVPAFLEPLRSPEYMGTVVSIPPANNLPVLHWFISNPTGADNTTGSRASLFYLGEFYDNVGMNLHGQSSANFPKKSYDIDFHRGYNFRWAAGEKRVDDINLLTVYPDKAHVRNVLAYETFRDAGTPYHFVVPVRVHQNGVFFSDAHLVENGDENYLDRLGMDTEGALYKMYNTLNVAAGEKKTRKNEDTSDLQALINGASLGAGPARNAFMYDSINIPEAINYLAAQTITGNTDCCHKNYYLYRDTLGSGEWQILPWDIDLSYGRVWSGGPTYWDDVLYANTALFVGNNNTLMSAIYGTPELRQMYLRRVRTLMEQLLQPPGTPASQGRIEKRADELLAAIGPDAALDLAKWGTWCCSAGGPYTQGTIPVPANYLSMAQAITQLKDYLPLRRTFLFNNQIVGGGGEIPLTQPTNAIITITHLEYSPASSNQAQEFVELRNTNSYAVDISGWRISGAIDHRFAPGTVMSANSSLFVTPDVKAFRARTTGPRGGQGLFVQGGYSGQLSARGETITIQDLTGRLVAITNYPGNPSLAQQYLRVTELMYHPSPLSGNTNSPEEFEYIELRNIGPFTMNLNGVRFTNGISFDFTGSWLTLLGPLQTVLVVKSFAAFTARYGSGYYIAGEYTGSLDNAGERIQLLDAVGEEIHDFSYNNSWFPITDGLGFSLVVVDELAAPDSWNNKSNWRPSGAVLGSPGANDPAPPVFSPVLVNEVLTRTVGVPDSIELYNPNTNDVDLSGWFLTDDFSTPAKFRIPSGTTISGGGYRVFTESNFNATPGVPPSFALSSDGDETYLFGALTNGNLTGFYHGFDFGAAHEGVSFGRYVSSEGKEHFVAQQSVTLDATNAGPRIGPLVISEIMYHPLDIGTNDNTADEFIEVLNITANSVPLFDPSAPKNTWKITGGIDFVFPTNLTLAAGEAVLVLNFSPTNAALLAAFRTNFNVATNVRVFGPYSGVLNNDSDEINLRQPVLPSGGTNIPYVLIEKVQYQDAFPWTQVADGFGYSLQRWDAQAFGNEPTNWVAARLTPGAPSITNGGPTLLTSQPQGQTWILGYNASISVTATGTPPFFAQWRRNGTNIPGATNLVLNVTNVQPHHAGEYQVTVGNASAVVLSEKATVLVRLPVALLTQPQTIDVRIAPDPAAAPATNVTFVSSASSTVPVRYQWRRNGVNIPDATNANLTIVNVQTNDLAHYSVHVEDYEPLSFTESTNAWLYPLITPVFIEQPISQSVAVGMPVTLSAQIIGWPPPFTFEWRLGAATVSSATGDQPFSFFTVIAPTNVTSVSYRAVAKNRAFPSGRVSNFGVITTLADSDLNGLPDAWEITYGVTNPAADADGDGMLNGQEYQAGTDPTNALSHLKISSMVWSNAALQFRFQAMSNKTYGIQYKTSLNPSTWQNLAEMVGRRTNRIESVQDTPLTNRFYRIVTPAP